MMSTESQAQNKQQQPTTYDERVYNERIRQLFDSIDSASISHSPLPPNDDIGQMTSIVDALFPEQASLYQQQKQRDQRHSSTNDLTTAFERLPLWSTNTTNNITNNNSSASAFCGGSTNGSSAFANRRQGKLHSSTRSLRNANYQQQQQQQPQHHYRPPPLTRPRFTSSMIRLQSAAATTIPAAATTPNNTNGLQRSSSTLSNNNSTNSATDYQPRFASRLSSSRLPTAAPPVGSHDQIVGTSTTIDPIAPSTNLGVMSQPTSAAAVLARSTSSTNAQPQQFVTMTQTTTTTFCYVPASGSLAYNNVSGTNRSTTVSHH
ncbi:unnamed protein product [Adineta steineri]|uniref:Uncharacterized protein n=1 Tax=Adineta steineri TaxID=433720 RepID=A0A814UI87_9BILA|nr:unnamed protein product [Adineta steineri]CAF3946195.1 unnamed protein product [Adineta steineri]